MTQEEKDLVLRDLCARLPYGVKCQMEDKLIIDDSPFYDCTLTERYIELFRYHKDFYIKPYLRPMSSMTKEEYNELADLLKAEDSNLNLNEVTATIEIDWLNKKMFDYRGLIPSGHAIEVTKENNPYKY